MIANPSAFLSRACYVLSELRSEPRAVNGGFRVNAVITPVPVDVALNVEVIFSLRVVRQG